jgi:PilZ domain-containing protein
MQLTPDFGDAAIMALRRLSPRVAGPFDGRRCGALTVPLRIHDLSLGGCLIESHYEATTGRRIKLEIELPYVGWITVFAEILYLRENFGFAVEFVDIDDEVRDRLEGVIDRLLTKSPTDE